MRRAAYSADSLPPNYNAAVRLPDSSIFYRRCPEKSGIYPHHMVVSRDMTDQLARAGTSVGANIHEAQYAQSKKDFIAKLEIALKESNETSYWLKLMYETKRIDLASYKICRETVRQYSQTADCFLQNSKRKTRNEARDGNGISLITDNWGQAASLTLIYYKWGTVNSDPPGS